MVLTFLLNPIQNYTENSFTQVIAREIRFFVNNLTQLLIKVLVFSKYLKYQYLQGFTAFLRLYQMNIHLEVILYPFFVFQAVLVLLKV